MKCQENSVLKTKERGRMMDTNIIKEVIAVAKRLDEKNLVNTFEGNISAKYEGKIFITPTTKNKGLLTEDMIAVIDSEGNQIGGNSKPTSELPMHMATYKLRDNIGGVVHCHPTFMTAYAICNIPITTKAYPEMMGNFDTFEVIPYGRPGTEKILKGSKEIFEHSDIVLLGNHGILAVGETVTDAMNKVEAAEAITKTLFIANMIGKAVDLAQEEQDFLKKVWQSHWI